MYRFSATLSTPTVPFTSSGLRALFRGRENLGRLSFLFGRITGRRKGAVLGGGHRANRRDEGRKATGHFQTVPGKWHG
jgi:hypothetical protein